MGYLDVARFQHPSTDCQMAHTNQNALLSQRKLDGLFSARPAAAPDHGCFDATEAFGSQGSADVDLTEAANMHAPT